MQKGPIVIAGATGNLGGRLAAELREKDVIVRALVRHDSKREDVARLREIGVEIVKINYDDQVALIEACRGSSCVVSRLAGLHEVFVDAQTKLLNAAVAAGVPRFIPSDFSIDFTRLRPGSNRNLDLRRIFMERLDAAPIRATTVFNGAFTDMLTGQAPIVLFRFRRILHWGDAHQMLDFTTIDDTAAYTADAALDESAPRFLRIAGDTLSAFGLAESSSLAMGEEFKTFWAGGLWVLEIVIRIARTFFPGGGETYPPWQGMQYLHNMFEGEARLEPLDNERYGKRKWRKAVDVLREYRQLENPRRDNRHK